MTNKEIARKFDRLAKLMELHKDNPFKIRSYQNAYITLRKIGTPLAEIPEAELASIKGVGKAISAKITEILQGGHMAKLQEFEDKTPAGVQDLLQIKGLGPKKIRQLWKELEIESVGELLYACNENRLIALKGFGEKTQKDVLQKVQYFLQSQHQFHFASVEADAEQILKACQAKWPEERISFTGALRRKSPILRQIDVLLTAEIDPNELENMEGLKRAEDGQLLSSGGYPVQFHHAPQEQFGRQLFASTGPETFVNRLAGNLNNLPVTSTEEAVFDHLRLPYILPELRDLAADETPNELIGQQDQLVQDDDIRGVVHSHSTYSDGLHSLREMAIEARDRGFGYLVITDHSQSAFYANGLKPERVEEQLLEIDQLNKELAPFKILKGIESDILYDGSLDYEADLLAKFDVVIASVHSQLKMDKDKATQRLIKAIENPFTHMLGHPTGRLLLSREGYPIDHMAVIDACAAHNVSIELNANPLRLDLDWTWIPYALEKGVQLSINPDAHSKSGIDHIKYGVLAARKGGLLKENCLNCLEAEDFLKAIQKK
ncbi:MAG: helix-hairpin-helix domain-containing protein [Bacteroidota bacterium]